ncbi:2'-5' RNA ligase family protein [Aequorivita sp. SDUM287046]|uniref:2'-5' RNA ligase family protein n=1 Tax=Aequorivita aurantiaca TaxID=3053356 RepID=A0ABT8DH83_9FLAO|nr:2'-5' RNA ligase family protein [Aequorivita aurantiaca]MDN3724227.1 2'-5' RNA ligase family protein [Aequorivita aurantiaca]
MKQFLFVFIIFMGFTFNSCNTMKNEKIAIDVLIVPSEEMYSQALQLNSAIHNNNPETIKLDENHIPHITLLQGFIFEKDLPKVENVLKDVFESIKKEDLNAEKFSYSKNEAKSFAMISVEKSQKLMQLHEEVIEKVKPFLQKNASENAFVPNPDGSPISKSTLNYVPNFLKKYSYRNFDPHISLGVADKKVLDSLERNVFKSIDFNAASLSIYQLGDHGTAQKLLWKSE